MTRILIALLVCLLASGSAAQEPNDPLDEVRKSHVKGNVPPESSFLQLLKRDVKAYLKCEEVQVELLRRAPTQVGVSLPKYYLWVEGYQNGSISSRGAMRVAAVEQEQFEVLQYFTASSIRQDQEQVKKTFPAALVEDIVRRATDR